jgi:hypothetical protein
MARDTFRKAANLHAGPPEEVPELPAPVEFEVRVTGPLTYTVKVKGTSKKMAWDLVEDLCWPTDFQASGPPAPADAITEVKPGDDTVDPVANSLWRDGALVWERRAG